MQNLNMIEYRRYMFVNLQLVSLWNMDSFVPLLYSTKEREKRGWDHFETEPGVTSRLNRPFYDPRRERWKVTILATDIQKKEITYCKNKGSNPGAQFQKKQLELHLERTVIEHNQFSLDLKYY